MKKLLPLSLATLTLTLMTGCVVLPDSNASYSDDYNQSRYDNRYNRYDNNSYNRYDNNGNNGYSRGDVARWRMAAAAALNIPANRLNIGKIDASGDTTHFNAYTNNQNFQCMVKNRAGDVICR